MFYSDLWKRIVYHRATKYFNFFKFYYVKKISILGISFHNRINSIEIDNLHWLEKKLQIKHSDNAMLVLNGLPGSNQKNLRIYHFVRDSSYNFVIRRCYLVVTFNYGVVSHVGVMKLQNGYPCLVVAIRGKVHKWIVCRSIGFTNVRMDVRNLLLIFSKDLEDSVNCFKVHQDIREILGFFSILNYWSLYSIANTLEK